MEILLIWQSNWYKSINLITNLQLSYFIKNTFNYLVGFKGNINVDLTFNWNRFRYVNTVTIRISWIEKSTYLVCNECFVICTINIYFNTIKMWMLKLPAISIFYDEPLFCHALNPHYGHNIPKVTIKSYCFNVKCHLPTRNKKINYT